MKNSRRVAEYGPIVVLLVLCVYFSVVTSSEQSPVGDAAAKQVYATIVDQFGRSPRVLIAASDQPSDPAFAASLARDLTASGAQVVGSIQGEPKDAREMLAKLQAAGDRLDAIACTQVASEWLVVSDIKSDFPSLGQPRLITPRRYRWPNFLKAENLLNIANQIAVIAIVAIGMTFVIITGGIDLSVGSLLALSAVITAVLIRDCAGGVNASPVGMVLTCVVAIVICGAIGAFSGLMITGFAIPPFIVTLAVMLVSSGLAYIVAKGQSIYQIPESFVWLGREADLMGLPNAVVLMLILYCLAHVTMSRMRLGRYLYAVGGNSEAARLSGVPVKRVLLFA